MMLSRRFFSEYKILTVYFKNYRDRGRYGHPERLEHPRSQLSGNFCHARSFSVFDEPVQFTDLDTTCNNPPYHLSDELKFQLTGGDPENNHKLDILLTDLYLRKHRGHQLPARLSTVQWHSLMFVSRRGRDNFLATLCRKEHLSKLDREKKQVSQVDLELHRIKREADAGDDRWLEYRLFGNALFQRFYPRTQSVVESVNLGVRSMFEQTIVFDCSYNEYMRPMDISGVAKQILYSIQANKALARPFNIAICNLDSPALMHHFVRQNPKFHEIPMTVTDQDISHVVPLDKVVYLTPHCSVKLEYNQDDVYVIGGFVDKVSHAPYSRVRAKKMGVRIAALPLDDHVNWGSGTKSLCINQVFDILQRVRDSGDWTYALQSVVPSRKRRPGTDPRSGFQDLLRVQSVERVEKGFPVSRSEFQDRFADQSALPKRKLVPFVANADQIHVPTKEFIKWKKN